MFAFYILNGQIPPKGLFFPIAVAGAAAGVWGHRLWAAYVLALATLLEFAGEWWVSGSGSGWIGLIVSLAGAVVLTKSPSALSPTSVKDLPLKRIFIAGLFGALLGSFISAFFSTVVRIEFNVSSDI